MLSDLLKTVFLPLGIMFIMFGMGLGLRAADFKRVIIRPKAKMAGLAMQLLMLPALAFGLAVVMHLPGDLAVGLMLVAACPGGPTSNIITHLARGDTALSVTLTAVSSLVTVFTIPLVVGFSMEHFLAADAAIRLPFLKTLVQLMVVTLLPVLAGMWVLARMPGFAARMALSVNGFSIVFLALVILLAVLREENLGQQILAAGPAVVTLNLVSMGLAFGVSVALGLAATQRISITVEVGIQNATLALAIALGILDSARLAIPAVVYGLFMFATGALVVVATRRITKRRDDVGGPANG